MASTTLAGAAMRGIVCAVPGDPIDVATLGTAFDAADVEKIKTTVGLARLHRVRPGQTAGDLCAAAARELLDRLGWDPQSVDGLLMVTQNPDHFAPATACVIHGKLGLSTRCLAFDVGMGCSGYVYGSFLATQLVASGACRRVVLLAGDTSSVVASPRDRSVGLLFGDAGSATAFEASPDAAPASFVLATDGTGAEQLMIPAGAYRHRPTTEAYERREAEAGNHRAATDLYMDGLAVFNFTLQRVPQLVRETAALQGWEPADVDAVLFHQANRFILQTLAKKLKLDMARVPVNIDKYGNTSVATIALLLGDAIADRLTTAERSRVLMAGFGVGLSWAGAALTIGRLEVATTIAVT